MVRVDLIRAITFLAQTMTKWSTDCDLRLEALMGWIKKSVNYVQVAWIGDAITDLRLHLYCDADFAGCQTTNRCTSGVFMAIEGPHSFVPVGHGSKKQHVTSNSTTEAETCSGAFGLRQVGLPGSIIWAVIQGHDIKDDITTTGVAPSGGHSEDRAYRGQTGRMLSPNEVVLSKRVSPDVDKTGKNRLKPFG